jgi:nitrile hydratase beta subunit
MDGVHDMGGMHGFGPVRPEKNEPVFHEWWEGRVLALCRTMRFTGAWNGDVSRYAKEVLPPHVYLSSSYYKRWLLGLEWLAVTHGLVEAEEIEAGRALRPGVPIKRKLMAGGINPNSRVPYDREAPTPPQFAVGDRVRTKLIRLPTHSRLPRYARGRVGTVEHVHGFHVFPDSNAAGEGENPQWVYTVTFNGHDLWGPDSDPTLMVSIDAFEPYLERM